MADQAAILNKAREITGNKPSVAVGETGVPDTAILAALGPAVRDLARSFGDASSTKETIFTTTAGVQDYALADYVGADVSQVTEVMRSSAYVADVLSDEGEIDPEDGLPLKRWGTAIPGGGQGAVFDKIVATQRAGRIGRYSWEVVNGTTLRLYPLPQGEEVVAVRYLAAGGTITDLGAETEACLVWAACAAILDAVINRIMSDRATTATWGEAQTKRLDVLLKQRDRYSDLYRQERNALGA